MGAGKTVPEPAGRHRGPYRRAGRAFEKIDIEFDRFVRTVASVFLKTARDNVGVDTSDRAIALDGVEDDFILAARAVFGKRNSPEPSLWTISGVGRHTSQSSRTMVLSSWKRSRSQKI